MTDLIGGPARARLLLEGAQLAPHAADEDAMREQLPVRVRNRATVLAGPPRDRQEQRQRPRC